MAPRHTTDDSLDLHALGRLSEPDAAPVQELFVSAVQMTAAATSRDAFLMPMTK